VIVPPGVETPAVVIDLDRVDANAERLAGALAARDVGLRPHVKTHKLVPLARRQLEAGAVGLTTGTLGEAEVMAAAGLTDLFVAYPLWAVGGRAARLRTLHDAAGLAVGVDSIGGAERLAAAVDGARRPLRVLVELDAGLGRTGVVGSAAAVEVGGAARALGLDVVGVFTHGGHAYRGPDSVAPAAEDEVSVLADAAAALRASGIDVRVLSAGSTPTQILAAAGPVTEIRAGTYILGDRQQVALEALAADEVAIAVAATVVSDAVPGQVVVDAGAKVLSKDAPPILPGFGGLVGFDGAVVERVYDYHGVVRPGPDGRLPRLGEVVAIMPNHACPVVNLVDAVVVTRDGRIADRWRVDARGRNG
jgi:D-serine deaminase-like pyridoxal phosphate-dependent protein